MLLAACGGGGGGGGGGPPSNTAPIANAGPPQNVRAGVQITLDGTASSDADGIVASYAWTQTSGAAVSMTNATTSRPGFIAPQVAATATLRFSLMVTDNRGATSAAATVTITVNPNAIPVANAGTAQTVTISDVVQLSGTASVDADGSIATYAWTQSAGPSVALFNTTSPQAGFVVPRAAVAATLTFSLVVTDNHSARSTPSTVAVTVNPNTAPQPNPGPAQTLNSGATVILDASRSSDREGGPLTFAWTR
jgi:hypothetical protein